MSSLTQSALLAAAAVVSSVAALELGVRIALPPPQAVELAAQPAPAAGSALEPADVELAERVDEPEGIFLETPAGRRLRPNTRAIVKNHYLCQCTAEIRTNSLGYRNRELGPKTRPRVLVLGDSVTFADYVSEPESWVRRVESLSEQTSRPIETVNAGVWAIGLADEVGILLETGVGTEPDAVLLGWYMNDVQPSPGLRMLRVPAPLEWSWLARHVFRSVSVLRTRFAEPSGSAIPHETLEEWRERTAVRFPPEGRASHDTVGGFNQLIQELFFDWGSAWSDDAWAHMRPYFLELRRQAELHGFQLLVVGFPVYDQVEADFLHDYPQQQLRRITDELGVPMLDLLPPLREALAEWEASGRDPAKRLFYDWCHHTPTGNERIAAWVHAFLQEQLGDRREPRAAHAATEAH
jgi:hypothetical protein